MKNFDFRRLILFGGLVAALCGCSPQLYDVTLEMRHPSASGLNLTGKNVAIVYPYGLTQDEMKLTGTLAATLADRLDAAYPESDSTALYTIEYTENFSRMESADSLVSLILKTDADVLFLFGHPEEFAEGYKTGTFNLPLYCYDALGGSSSDAMKSFTVAADAGTDAEASGKSIGNKISSSFTPQWKTEDFGIWYTSGNDWYEALESALSFKWDDAVKKWIAILSDTKDSYLRATLEYNIGLGCFMMGNNALALEWLSQSSAESPTDETTALINRVKSNK